MQWDMSFVQTSSGGAAAAGNRVLWSGVGNTTGCQGNHEMSLARGISKISYIADRLQLDAHLQESARRMYQMALQVGFQAGRPTRFVACACLYLVCRRSRSPLLLMDFSDVLQTPVQKLGQVYVRLMQRLVGGDAARSQALLTDDIPLVDPSIYLERFSRKLDLGLKQRAVKNTAAKLIQFMHRDWICMGRRPNGLCGAALLVAAQYHGVGCSAKDIADVVRITEGTIRNRLVEMRRTPLALLDKASFMAADPSVLPVEDDTHLKQLPPCMQRRALKDAAQQAIEDAFSELSPIEDGAAAAGIGSMLPPRGKGFKRKQPVPLAPTLMVVEEASASASSSSAVAASTDTASASSTDKYTAREPSREDLDDIANEITERLRKLGAGVSSSDSSSASSSSTPASKGDLDAAVSRGIEELHAKSGEAMAGAAAAQDGAAMPSRGEGVSDDASEACFESLSDIDDAELDQVYMMDEEEKAAKNNIWHEVNKDYLEEWHVRSRETKRRKDERKSSRANSAADSASSHGGSSRGTTPRRKTAFPPTATGAEATAMALQKKGRVAPHRINMTALEGLFK